MLGEHKNKYWKGKVGCFIDLLSFEVSQLEFNSKEFTSYY